MLPSFIQAVKVVSLPQCTDRRNRIAPHLAETLALSAFEFHDAFDPDHPAVTKLYDDKKVHCYPPCFRCGKLDCGKPDCNNVLLPSQVANFATYLSLWRKIGASQEVTLVLEDDVFIHDWALDVLSKLADDVSRRKIDLAPDNPHIVRLGWALGPEHDVALAYRLGSEVRMSNPAFILTPAYARALVQRFEMVNHTSDVFAHSLAPRPGEATTVFPPIASDLSWSTGAVASKIHPKPIHSQWLLERGDRLNATKNDAKIRRHIKHIFYRPLLVTGHPRCGTGFAASLCRQLGLDVGHGGDGKHGVSSWMMAVDADENPWATSPVARSRRALYWDVLIHIVRDLETALPSVMRENQHAQVSFEFRRHHIMRGFGCDISDFESPVERAALSIVYWNRLVRKMNPDIVLKTGGDVPGFINQLRARGLPVVEPQSLDLSPKNRDKAYQGKHYPLPVISDADWCNVSNKTKDLLREEAARLDCRVPFPEEAVEPSQKKMDSAP